MSHADRVRSRTRRPSIGLLCGLVLFGLTDANSAATSQIPALPRDAGRPFSPQTSFTNPAPITIAGAVASPYPSDIAVSGLTGNISKVTVTITGFSHTFSTDVDMLLVAPNGANLIICSDTGGFAGASNVTITLDDAAASALPSGSALITGIFRPGNYDAVQDPFASPAPVGPYNSPAPGGAATFATVFNGLTPAQANGTWHLYVVDDFPTEDDGSISGGWTLNITTQGVPPTTAGQLIISEFRVRGPNGANDEFIELYNTTGASLTTQAADASAGLAVAASNGTARCVVPNGTVIPARGHFLCVNSVGYSISTYPAGNGATATGNLTYTTDIPDNAGIAIFNNSTGGGSFSTGNRLDAVGSTSEANTTYKEGTGYPALTPFSIDYSFYRAINATTGLPTDTGNNAADFVFVDTNGTSAGAGQRLGAPGPENLSSPVGGPGTIPLSLVDTGCADFGAAMSACARSRDLTNDAANNSTFGTLSIRRKVTNNTGGSVTQLRFRIFDLTTFPAPPGIADLRPRTSTTFVANLSGGGTTTIQGLTLEQPPSQPNGGGFNSSVSAGSVTLGTPLSAGASVNVQFLLGIQQTGCYRFAIVTESLPGGGSVFITAGHTETATSTVPTVTATATTPTSVAGSYSAPMCAATYEVYRKDTGTGYNKIATSVATNFVDNAVAANTAHLYAIQALDAGGGPLGLGEPDLATTVIFTDPTITPALTTIQAAHINELRTAVNAVRSLAGLAPTAFSPTLIVGSTPIQPAHILDLRSALNSARSTLGLPATVYTDAALVAQSTIIKAAHIDDLREGVR